MDKILFMAQLALAIHSNPSCNISPKESAEIVNYINEIADGIYGADKSLDESDANHWWVQSPPIPTKPNPSESA